jgi:hypothetical protein
LWQWSFLKPFSGKGFSPSSGSSIVMCNIMNTSETAAMSLHTGVFTNVYLMQLCVWPVCIKEALCISRIFSSLERR